jgi:hypothetical protein
VRPSRTPTPPVKRLQPTPPAKTAVETARSKAAFDLRQAPGLSGADDGY